LLINLKQEDQLMLTNLHDAKYHHSVERIWLPIDVL